jgi:hypothetical protein
MSGISVHAEVRTWKDNQGKTYEAELVAELFDKATLRDVKGVEFRIPIEELSENDQKYLRVMVPPEMKIEFSVKTEAVPLPKALQPDKGQALTKIIHPSVTVQKLSRRLFTSSLNLELFLVGKGPERRDFILLSKSDYKFLFETDSDKVVNFTPDPVTVSLYTDDSNQRRGEEYLGHLIVISDARGNIVKTQTDIGEWIESPAVIENLRMLALRGASTIRSRYFDKTGKKVDPPRTQFYKQRLAN